MCKGLYKFIIMLLYKDSVSKVRFQKLNLLMKYIIVANRHYTSYINSEMYNELVCIIKKHKPYNFRAFKYLFN